MNTQKTGKKNQRKHLRRNGQRGIALVFTLLLLTMMIALSLAMAIAIGSQTMIAGYYKNYRGSFYAADSGLNVVRQAMRNQIIAAVPASLVTGAVPIPDTTAATIQLNIQTAYAGWSSVNSTGSWPEQFELGTGSATFSRTSCPVTSWTGPGAGPYSCTSLPPAGNVATGFSYTYAYTINVTGQVQNSEQQSLTETGNLVVNIAETPSAGTQTLFSAWGMFVDHDPECAGPVLVAGTITGPVFTNDGFTFNAGSNYIFTDTVGFGAAAAGFNFTNGSGCNSSTNGVSSLSAGSGGNRQTIAPQFNGAGGLQLAQNHITPPTDSINQEWAVLDGNGKLTGDTTSPTNAQMNTHLVAATLAATAYPTAGASTGVYLPVTTTPANFPANCAGPRCFTGGGIYVEGGAKSVMLSTTGTNIQNFTIVQGSTTTLISENLSTNTTTVSVNGTLVQTINSLPFDSLNSPATAATMVYVDGDLGSSASNLGLSGPGEGVAAVQNNTQITITANGNINITGDILYKTEPVTTTANQTVSSSIMQTGAVCCNGDAADFLIPLNSANSSQVLGIFTANGNIQLDNQQADNNLQIDASVAAFTGSGTGTITNVGNNINNLNIVGGRIQSQSGNINATNRNIYFDRRFTGGSFGPPWFPTAVVTPVNTSTTSSNVVVQRIQWLNNSATMN